MAISIYSVLVKQITRNKDKVASGTMTEEEYATYMEETISIMDIYLLGERITEEEYPQLLELLG